mgnify:CR=1 FL=1
MTTLKLIVFIEILNISAVYSKIESANEPDKEFKKPDKLIKEPIKEIKRLKCYTSGRDIHIERSKQFKWNSYLYVSGQSRLFWAALKLL